MPRITYFQRYSTQENAVTNTTLHLFSQIYRHSPERLKEFLSELLGNETIPLGVDFVQQTRSQDSVPDAAIHQEPVHILIETKVAAGVDVSQLVRHCKSFNPKSQGNFLVLLTRSEIPASLLENVHTAARDAGAIFCKTTFELLCASLTAIASEHETHLKTVVDDFIAYCGDSGLLVDRRKWLSIVPCGKTFELNEKWCMYYQPSDRGYCPQDYIGIYTDKAVWLIGRIDGIYDSLLDAEGEMILTFVSGNDLPIFRDRIIGMIAETKEKVGWDLTAGTRFYCAERLLKTQFKKTSSGGIMGGRYWDITKSTINASTDEQLADSLTSQTWE